MEFHYFKLVFFCNFIITIKSQPFQLPPLEFPHNSSQYKIIEANSSLTSLPEHRNELLSNIIRNRQDVNTKLITDREVTKLTTTAEKGSSKYANEAENMLHEGTFKSTKIVFPQEVIVSTQSVNEESVREETNSENDISQINIESVLPDETEFIENVSKTVDDNGKNVNDMVLINAKTEKKTYLAFGFREIIGLISMIALLLFVIFCFVHKWKKSHDLQIKHKILVEEDDNKHFSI